MRSAGEIREPMGIGTRRVDGSEAVGPHRLQVCVCANACTTTLCAQMPAPL